MPPLHLAGVLIHTSEDRFGAMRAFYVDTLGLTPRSDRPGFVNFEWGSMRLTVHVHSGVSGGSAEPHRVLVNFVTADIDGDVARLSGAGVELIRPPQREGWGGRVATLADPDGNLVQLLEMGGE